MSIVNFGNCKIKKLMLFSDNNASLKLIPQLQTHMTLLEKSEIVRIIN